MDDLKLSGKLVNATQLLEALFEPECRPSLRWVRTQTRNKTLPFFRVGHLIFYDLEMVRTALAKRALVRGRFLSNPSGAFRT